jgi:hypothetical protein
VTQLDEWGRSPETAKVFAESGNPYVPLDWAGPITTCELCGNQAPDLVREKGPDAGKKVCEPCYEGGKTIAKHRDLAESAGPLPAGKVRLLVENTYSDGHESERVVDVDAPPAGTDALEDWWQETAFNETGDGHYTEVYEATGARLGSCYTVTILAAEDRHLIGRENEWLD